MTSSPREAYVWIWLPNEVAPVVAGKLTAEKSRMIFNYGRTYLERKNCPAIYERELPLLPGFLPLLHGLTMPGCIRDAAPDAWGRRVIINKLFGANAQAIDSIELDELTYLLESGSDRIGALDFQRSATVYEPREAKGATLEALLQAADRVEHGQTVDPDIALALYHGSAIGGARPKALIETDEKKYIAKFSSTSDITSVVKAEFIAMTLAQKVGLTVAPVMLQRVAHRDVLLVERFDRIKSSMGWQRKRMVSALTLLELDEMMARYASYGNLGEIIRMRFHNVGATLRQLFNRIVFNILVGNNDDHARNHAAFLDDNVLSLTPAYDICPQNRSGNVATQAMAIAG